MKKTNSNLKNIVAILNDGNYHDRSSIGTKLNITRSAVWKIIKKLENYGLKIDSIKGKGYALREPLILLDKDAIKNTLGQKNLAIDIFESIDSTNEYLKTFYDTKFPRVCLAEYQTHGKGRLHRNWHSPFGQNIYLSCLYPFNKDISELAGLSLVISLAIVKTLKTLKLPKLLSVKWPNDIIYQDRKLAGILIEVQAESHGVCNAIIGIGINVNILHDKDHHISQAWTSIGKILGDYVDRNPLCAFLIDNLIYYVNRFIEVGFASFINEWQTVDYLLGKKITLKSTNHKIYGRVTGINQQGHLLLKLKNGKTQAFSSGDTIIMK